MDCNKDDAIRAKELAEIKMKNNDFVGARKIVQKAQNLCPELENILQLLSICDVHCSAQNLLPGSEKDWYGVLQVERFADEIKIKKQYRRLALFLHPDKNPFPGAEAAFKLICEANTVLSDPQKKSLYDSKIRVMVRSALVVPPPHHSNNAFQVNKKYAETKVSNGHCSMNQHQTKQSSYSVQVFCTSCPFCHLIYKMDRKFVNTALRCQKCSRVFTGFETSVDGVPLSKSAPESSQNAGVQNGKGYSASYMGSPWCANKQKVPPQPGVRTESIFKDQGVGRAAKVSRNMKEKRKDSGSNNEYGEKEGGTCNGYPNSKESSKKNKRKGRRRVSTESSESDNTSSSESDLEDVTAGYGVATNLNSGPTRRSSRKRQNISYTEGGDDDDDDENRQDAMDGETAEHEKQNGLHTDADLSKSKSKVTGSVYPEERPQDKSDNEKGFKAKGEGGGKPNIGDDVVEIEIDSDRDVDTGDDSYKESYQYADPEFNNFECDVNCFAVNQYWSCYDSADGMPRFYAKVKKVLRLSPFELSIAWLEADSADDTLQKWIDEELPVGCGTFRVGKTQKVSGRDTFAQQVHCEKGKRGSLIIHPRRGEIWALFRDWDLSWSSQPDNHREYKYEVVEVLSEFDAPTGVRVCYLDKVEGFVSLFQRSRQSAIESFMIRPEEIFRLSHCIRSFKMTGTEREGVPVGSFELDPAALPLNPDHLYYPAKSKMETDIMKPGVNCAPPKSDR